jgi:hypothetical protein
MSIVLIAGGFSARPKILAELITELARISVLFIRLSQGIKEYFFK